MVTHDPELTARSDAVLTMRDGRTTTVAKEPR